MANQYEGNGGHASDVLMQPTVQNSAAVDAGSFILSQAAGHAKFSAKSSTNIPPLQSGSHKFPQDLVFADTSNSFSNPNNDYNHGLSQVKIAQPLSLQTTNINDSMLPGELPFGNVFGFVMITTFSAMNPQVVSPTTAMQRDILSLWPNNPNNNQCVIPIHLI